MTQYSIFKVWWNDFLIFTHGAQTIDIAYRFPQDAQDHHGDQSLKLNPEASQQ